MAFHVIFLKDSGWAKKGEKHIVYDKDQFNFLKDKGVVAEVPKGQLAIEALPAIEPNVKRITKEKE